MDPTANLARQIALAQRIVDATNNDDIFYDTTALADLVLALHEWIAKGGHLPEQWSKISR